MEGSGAAHLRAGLPAVESNLLQPLVYSQAVQLNGLVILIALLVGGQLLGIPGALLAIPVAEIIRIVVTEILAYRRSRVRGERARRCVLVAHYN